MVDELLFGLTRDEWIETALAAAIVVAGIVIAAVAAVAAARVIRHFTRGRGLDDRLARRLRIPFIVLVTLWAVSAALRTLSYFDEHGQWIHGTVVILSVLVVAIALRRVLVELLLWQAARPGANGKLHPGSIPLIRRGITILIFAASALIMLDALGVAISPLLAGLGIGGLAVALALQPLLANVFASSYMLSDSSIRIGDWVEVTGGPAGSVDDIGWRATRIRTFDNNIVVVPNSLLADSVVTNYSLTALESDARANIGVPYGEDLDRVESLCREVMVALRDESVLAYKDHEPVISILGFSDAGVDFLLKMRGVTWIDSLGLRHEMVKRIHARLSVEGIAINYPARRLLMQEHDIEGLRRLAATRSGDGNHQREA